MKTFEIAKKYLEFGWSVFPVVSGAKNPPKVKWAQFQNERMSTSDVKKYFQEGDNIALACGPVSGVLVVDLDSYKEKGGDIPELPDTPLKVSTPRGGEHRYYRYSEGSGNTVNYELATDIRSKGGYVLLPPSFVDYGDEVSREPYKWSQEPTADLVKNLPVIPEKVLNKIYGKSEFVLQEGVLRETQNFTPFDISKYENISEGGRNDSIYHLSMHFINKIGEENAFPVIMRYNAGYSPPLSEREVRTAFKSASDFIKKSPPFVSKKNNSGNNLLKKESVSDPSYKFRSTKELLKDTLEILDKGAGRGIETGFSRLDKAIGGFFPGQSYLLFADTSVGKSVFMVNILTNIVKMGVEKCMYFDLENKFDQMTVDRLLLSFYGGNLNLDSWREIKQMDPGEEKRALLSSIMEPLYKYENNYYVWDLGQLPQRFGNDPSWVDLKKCIVEGVAEGYRIFMIDHLHYFSPSETDHSVIGNVAKEINDLAAVHNIVIIVAAHTRKGLTHADRSGHVSSLRPTLDHIHGSKMIAGHFKNAISLQRNTTANDPEEKRTVYVYVDKTKYGPTDHFILEFEEKSMVFYDPEERHDMVLFQRKNEEKNVVSEIKIKKVEKEKEVSDPQVDLWKQAENFVKSTKNVSEKYVTDIDPDEIDF